MASDMLCCQGGTFRHDGCQRQGRTGPGPGVAALPTCLGGVRTRAPLARGALRDRYPHVRARHLCAAVSDPWACSRFANTMWWFRWW